MNVVAVAADVDVKAYLIIEEWTARDMYEDAMRRGSSQVGYK